MSARFESDYPETTEVGDSAPPQSGDVWAEDSAILVRKLYSNTERLQKATEALELFPDSVEGAEAMFLVEDLLDQLHETPYDDVEHLFTRIRTIYQAWGISLPI